MHITKDLFLLRLAIHFIILLGHLYCPISEEALQPVSCQKDELLTSMASDVQMLALYQTEERAAMVQISKGK